MKRVKMVDVSKKYNMEIQKIKNKMSQLKQNRIYEISGVRGDGYLHTNVLYLEELLVDLLEKIEYGDDSISDQIGQAFKGINK